MAGMTGRNDPCPCGSGRKFKKCCEAKERSTKTAGPAAPVPPRSSPAAGVRTATLRKAATGHWAAGRSAEAIAAFRTIAQLEPQSADANHNLGAALFGVGQLAEAAVSLTRAIELRPSFEAALRLLANTLEHLGREAEAAAAYRRLSRVTRGQIEQRLVLAKALTLEDESGEAEVVLRRAVAAAPANAGAQVLLGQLLLEKGEFDEAERCLVKAIDVFPDAFQHLAASRPMNEADRPLLDRMAALVERSDLDPMQRGAIHFGLGKGHNDLRDYAEAMRHYEAGNALRGGAGRLDRAGLVGHYDDLIGNYSAAALEAGKTSAPGEPCAEDDLPVLIVGMPRSGTTLVEQILSSHPDVVAGGELSFWSDRVKQWMAAANTTVEDLAGSAPYDGPITAPLASRSATTAIPMPRPLGPRASRVRSMTEGMLSRAARDYHILLRQIGPRGLRVTDKAPFNFERLGQIRAALPAMRIIHCRRHPVDTCLSMFFTNYKGRQSWTRADLLFQYRQYQRLMEHWRSTMSADRFIEVDYETMIADREGQTRRMIDFAGLEWDAACMAPQENRRMVRSASLWQARQPTYTGSLDRWVRYEPWLGEFRELLPDGSIRGQEQGSPPHL